MGLCPVRPPVHKARLEDDPTECSEMKACSFQRKPLRSATFFQKTLGYSPGCCILGQLMWCQVKTDCYFLVSTAVGPNRFLLMTNDQ